MEQEYREVITEFCNFGKVDHEQRAKPADIENCPQEEISIRELDEFGHTYKGPIGVLKMNILQ